MELKGVDVIGKFGGAARLGEKIPEAAVVIVEALAEPRGNAEEIVVNFASDTGTEPDSATKLAEARFDIEDELELPSVAGNVEFTNACGL